MRFDLPFRTRSLKSKLILSYLVILGIGGLVTSIVGSYIVSSTMMTQAQRTVEHDLAAARSVFDQELAALRQAVWLLSRSLTERDLRGPARTPTPSPTLADVRESSGFDFLSIADAAGRVTRRVGQPAATGDDVSGRAVIRLALSGRVAHLFEPKAFVTRARKRAPLSGSCAEAIEYVDDVAPGMSTPLRCHW